MKVKDLIYELSQQPAEAEVIMIYDGGATNSLDAIIYEEEDTVCLYCRYDLHEEHLTASVKEQLEKYNE